VCGGSRKDIAEIVRSMGMYASGFFLPRTVFIGACKSSTLEKRVLNALTLSSGLSKMSMICQGTEERSSWKFSLEKRQTIEDGEGLGVLQRRSRRIGRWSEIGISKTAEFKIGTSGEEKNKSKIKLEVSEY
jgi:hypothetical protein